MASGNGLKCVRVCVCVCLFFFLGGGGQSPPVPPPARSLCSLLGEGTVHLLWLVPHTENRLPPGLRQAVIPKIASRLLPIGNRIWFRDLCKVTFTAFFIYHGCEFDIVMV